MLGCNHHHQIKIPKRFYNKNQANKSIQGSPICLTDSDHDFIIEKSNLETQLNMIEKIVDVRCE